MQNQNEYIDIPLPICNSTNQTSKELPENIDTAPSMGHNTITINLASKKKPILALDLDNTLIHAELVEKDGEPLIDISTIDLQNNSDLHVLELGSEKLLVKLRPYVISFLQNMSKKYQVFLCTRGIKVYVDHVLEWIDPDRIYIPADQVIPGEALTAPKSVVLKRVIGDYRTAIVLDDSPELWGRRQDKVIFTKPFYYFQAKEDSLIIRRTVDAFLLLTQELLNFIHRVLMRWPFKKPCISLSDVYQTTLGSLFSKKTFAFFQVFNNNEEMPRSRVYYDLKRFGAENVVLDATDNTDIIFSKYDNDLSALGTSDIPVISLLYINYCEMFGTCLEPEIFDLRNKDSIIVNLEKVINESSPEQEQEKIKNSLLDQMEEFIITDWEQKGNKMKGLDEDVVINKLKEKYIFKKVNQLEDSTIETNNFLHQGAEFEDKIRKKTK